MKLLIIEDDNNASKFINFAFRAGWPEVQVLSALNGLKGVEIAKSEQPDVILLDLGLPDISGFEVIKHIRKSSSVPIIVTTVTNNEPDIVQALELGADEYILKPFGQMEIIARVKAFTRRMEHSDKQQSDAVLGPWRFNPEKSQVYDKNYQISLTHTENLILQHLVANAGNVVTYNSLVESLWGNYYPGSLQAIRVYINRLRQKIEQDPRFPTIICTKIGIGYYIAKNKQKC